MIEKIKIDIPNINININDITYKIKIKNKSEERKERLIFFGYKQNLEKIKQIKDIFLDITFKIIPRNFYPYKLLVMSGFTKNEKQPIILTFVLLKYLDNISYERIFNFLIENYELNPCIIHTDFEKSLQKAISNIKIFNNKIIHSRCFFHFSKMIRGKLSQIGVCKKKLNKFNVELITNIELLCFLSLDKIKPFQKIIIDKLKDNKNLYKFLSYLKKYLFKLNPIIYNYNNIIEYYKKENGNKFLDYLYTTNNICESINSKLDFYLPKKATTNYCNNRGIASPIFSYFLF